MEWNNRGTSAPQNNNSANNLNSNPSTSGPAPHKPFAPPPKKGLRIPRGRRSEGDRGWRIASVILLFTITLLAISVIAYLAFFRSNVSKQSDYVDSSKYQAVFLNGGQVYFGKISSINFSFTALNNIYYLRVNQQVQPNGQSSNQDVQLVKLGCELHGPQDQMIINSEQVVFWENLKDDGQVAQAIKKYVAENPEGQKCTTQSSNSNSNETTQQNNSNTNNNTNNTTTNP